MCGGGLSPPKAAVLVSEAMPSPALIDSHADYARNFDLRYVWDDRPGYTRRRSGKGFSYLKPDGSVVRDKEERKRIKALVIPPAYEEVWICMDPRGHLQATGRDTRGRKQYVYHERWAQVRDVIKYSRLAQFAKALPEMRRTVNEHMQLRGLPRKKVLATVVRLLDDTLIRIGNAQYAKDNGSYGLTTIRRKHVKIEGSVVSFEFTGKSGLDWTVQIRDRRLARIVRQCHQLPGYEVFKIHERERGTGGRGFRGCE